MGLGFRHYSWGVAVTGFPRTVEAITPQWLTEVLRADGVLTGGRVRQVTAARLGVGVGFMSAMCRLTLTYDGPAPGAPGVLIAKLAPAYEGARAADGAFQFYERETGFYRALAAGCGLRTARAFHVSYDAGSHDFILLLEDLSAARVADQVAGLSLQDAADALAAVAGLHGRWWNDPTLADHDWLPAVNAPTMRVLEPVYQQCWPAVVDFLGDRLSPQMKALGERMATRVGSLLDVVASRPRTVVHGDFRADNMFFRDTQPEDRFAVIDWQVMMQGSGAFDVAYMLSGSFGIADRRQHERDLLAIHHRGLLAAGVQGYSPAEAADDYRLCTLLGWGWPVVAIGSLDMANDRGVAMFNAWTERAMTAVMDLDAGALLPDT